MLSDSGPGYESPDHRSFIYASPCPLACLCISFFYHQVVNAELTDLAAFDNDDTERRMIANHVCNVTLSISCLLHLTSSCDDRLPPSLTETHYSLSNVIMADEILASFHQYLRYFHKRFTIVFSIPSVII